MLKKFFLGFKEVPVPIPIRNLGEFYEWIERSFVKEGTILTSLNVDGKQYIDHLAEGRAIPELGLSDSSVVTINVDSPKSLSLQTLEAVRDLCDVIQQKMKELGVEYWQYSGSKPGKQLEDICNDILLMLELIDHINGLTDYSHEHLAAVNGLFKLVTRCHSNLLSAVAESRWKEVASILVNRLDYYLKELVTETENLQIILLSQEGKSMYTSIG